MVSDACGPKRLSHAEIRSSRPPATQILLADLLDRFGNSSLLVALDATDIAEVAAFLAGPD